MPYQTVTEYMAPDVFLEHNGVTIYHAYRNDEYDDPMSFWFAVNVDLDAHCDEGDGDTFDIRELPHPKTALLNQPRLAEEMKKAQAEGKDWNVEETAIIKSILTDMIDAGVITNEGVKAA